MYLENKKNNNNNKKNMGKVNNINNTENQQPSSSKDSISDTSSRPIRNLVSMSEKNENKIKTLGNQKSSSTNVVSGTLSKIGKSVSLPNKKVQEEEVGTPDLKKSKNSFSERNIIQLVRKLSGPQQPTTDESNKDETLISKEPDTDISVDSDVENNTEVFGKGSRPYDITLEYVVKLRHLISRYCSRYKKSIQKYCKILFIVLYFVYFICAIRYRFGDKDSVTLVSLTCIVSAGLIYSYLKKTFGTRVYESCGIRIVKFVKRQKVIINRFMIAAALLSVGGYIFIDKVFKNIKHALSGVGIIIYLGFMFLLSHDPAKVRWRPVVWGILLQFVFALVVLRTSWGQYGSKWLSEQVITFLSYTDAGAKFVFGDFKKHYFAFHVLPIIIFFSATISVLYYIGWIQVVIEKIGFFLQFSLDTGGLESLHAAINIFVGWGEGVMIIRPVLDKMSLSEIHTVMTNGFATVAGSTLGIYHLVYKIPANHLITASFMSAPAALAVSKLFWPDEEDNSEKRKAVPEIPCMGHGIIDAASAGAVSAITICTYIAVNVITFLSLLAFVNATLRWFGERAGLENLTFQFICSYLFWPLVLILGIRPEDCYIVARLVGTKIFVNEFLAYSDLGIVRSNRIEFETYNGSWTVFSNHDVFLHDKNITLYGGIIEPRSEMIATYALCGFSDLVAFAMMIGALSAAAPSRKTDFIKVGPRALISGICSCFLTACMSGLLGGSGNEPESLEKPLDVK